MNNRIILVNGLVTPRPRNLRVPLGTSRPNYHSRANRTESDRIEYLNRTMRSSIGRRRAVTSPPPEPNNRILRLPSGTRR